MKKIIIFTDGAARGNPGPAGAGVVICNEKSQPIKRYSKFLGKTTNNEAEYQALIFALKMFKKLSGKKMAKATEVEVRADSQLMVKQLKGEYKILDEKLQPLFLEAWNLCLDFKNFKIKFISREKNKEADILANKGIDEEVGNLKLF